MRAFLRACTRRRGLEHEVRLNELQEDILQLEQAIRENQADLNAKLTEVAGLDEQRVRAVSYGESKERLVAPGEYGPNAGEANRRVVIVVDEVSSDATVPVAGRR